MSRKSSARLRFAHRKSYVAQIVEKSGKAIQNKNLTVYPSAKNGITKVVKKALEKNVIDSDQVNLVVQGLFSFGIDQAKKNKSRKITINNIKEGYRIQAGFVPQERMRVMEHAMHRCLLRTIVERETEVRQIAAFQEISESSDEN
ncbi:MAG TPA: hypothetical protein VF596_11910 [Pyrinomonadaceae bacterium]|jgi:hypothetical protein